MSAAHRAVTAARGRVLLINPRMTSRRHARFPLSIMTLAAQMASAIEVSSVVRRVRRDMPIVWGGYFPTLYPELLDARATSH